MSVNKYLVPFIVIGSLLGSVLLAGATGVWSITGRDSTDLEQLAPEDIKGWMTLQQVIDGVPIAQETLYKLVNIPDNIPPSTAIKDLEALVPGFETSTLRDALTALSGAVTPQPQPTALPTQTPVPAVSTPQTAATSAHTGDGSGPTPLPAGQTLPADQIKGRMTLREVSQQCAVSLEALLAALKLSPDINPDTEIKTLTGEGKLSEVSQVQEAVAALQKPQ
jgi:hypothetical protein